jgi:hypothetical protein
MAGNDCEESRASLEDAFSMLTCETEGGRSERGMRERLPVPTIVVSCVP